MKLYTQIELDEIAKQFTKYGLKLSIHRLIDYYNNYKNYEHFTGKILEDKLEFYIQNQLF